MANCEDRNSTSRHPAAGGTRDVPMWRAFVSRFPTEADCVEELLRISAEEGQLRCRACGNDELKRSRGCRVARCDGCGRENWLTAGSFFHRIRRARPWLAAIWLIEHGVAISSSRFHKLLDIAYSSALHIFKKLTMVLDSEMQGDGLSLRTSVFAVLFGKRSRETPARGHPILEENFAEQDNVPERLETEVAHADELSDQERIVFAALADEPVYFDDLFTRLTLPAGELSACLTMLELAGVVDRLAGDAYVRRRAGSKTDVRQRLAPATVDGDIETTRIDRMVDFLCGVFHRISRRYLQLYLSAYWGYTDRSRWSREALLRAAIRVGQINIRAMRSYVTPRFVRVPAKLAA